MVGNITPYSSLFYWIDLGIASFVQQMRTTMIIKFHDSSLDGKVPRYQNEIPLSLHNFVLTLNFVKERIINI